jgi:hypothetical protein
MLKTVALTPDETASIRHALMIAIRQAEARIVSHKAPASLTAALLGTDQALVDGWKAALAAVERGAYRSAREAA